jgi:DNA repair protein RadC
MNKIKNEEPPKYFDQDDKLKDELKAKYIRRSEDDLIAKAKHICKSRLTTFGIAFTSPDIVKDFLTLELSNLESERFDILFLNNQNQLIEHIPMFSGTIDGASVYPREIMKIALDLNAAALILAHNHPSGICDPSNADIKITTKIKAAMDTVDIRVLDHIIVGGTNTYSFAESGIM